MLPRTHQLALLVVVAIQACGLAGCGTINERMAAGVSVCAAAEMVTAAKLAAVQKHNGLITREPYCLTANTHSDPPAGTLASRSSPENSE